MGSQNLANTIGRTIVLRRFGFVGSAVVLLWLLSPVGGQSSLRILATGTSNLTSTGQMHYLNTTSTLGYLQTAFQGADELNSAGPSISAVLQASLLSPESARRSPRDSWNNVKIPRLNAISPFTMAHPDNPWVTINYTNEIQWTSLSGLIIHGLPDKGTSTFSIETSYTDLSCPHNTRYEASPNGTYDHVFKNGLWCHNTSWPFTAQF
jgi:hypothetical protein